MCLRGSQVRGLLLDQRAIAFRQGAEGFVGRDGRKIHPAYLFEVKKPSESKGPYDYYKLVATIPANEAFRPLSESDCPLVKK